MLPEITAVYILPSISEKKKDLSVFSTKILEKSGMI